MYHSLKFIEYLNIALLGFTVSSLHAGTHMQGNCPNDARGNGSLNVEVIADTEDTVGVAESPFLRWDELRIAGAKPDGLYPGLLAIGSHDGRRWMVKQMPTDACATEYIVGSILSLWANKNIPGANFPNIKLIKDEVEFVASEILPDFKTAEQQIMADFGYASEKLMMFLGGSLLKEVDQLHNVAGREFRLLIEMLLCLADRHIGNVGFIEKNGHLEYASIDFDQSLIPFASKLNIQLERWSNSGDYRKCVLPEDAPVMGAFLRSLHYRDNFPLPTGTSYIDRQNLVNAIEALVDMPIEAIEEAIRSAVQDLHENGVAVSDGWMEKVICHVYLKKQVMEDLLEVFKNYPEEMIKIEQDSPNNYVGVLIYSLISLFENAHKYFPSII